MAAALIIAITKACQRVDAQRGDGAIAAATSPCTDGRGRDRRSPAAVLAGSQTCPRSAGACRGRRRLDSPIFAIAKSRLLAAIEGEQAPDAAGAPSAMRVDRDVWGRPYGTVMSCLRDPRATPPREPNTGASDGRRSIPDGDRGADPATAGDRPVLLSWASSSRSFEEPAPGSRMGSQPRRRLAPGCLPEGVLGVPERWRPSRARGRGKGLCCCRSRAGRLMLLPSIIPSRSAVHARHGGQDPREDHMQTSGGVHGGPRRPFGSPARFRRGIIDPFRRHRVRQPLRPVEAVGGARGQPQVCCRRHPRRSNAFTRRGGTTSSPRSSEFLSPSTCRQDHLQITFKPECWNTTPMMARSLQHLGWRSSRLGPRPDSWERNVRYSILRLRLDDGVRHSHLRATTSPWSLCGGERRTRSRIFSAAPLQGARLTFKRPPHNGQREGFESGGSHFRRSCLLHRWPRSSRRRCYANGVIDSIPPYGAPIWSCGPGARARLAFAAEAIHRRACLQCLSWSPRTSSPSPAPLVRCYLRPLCAN
ncbi:unnamed protein product [Trichogramma brassicae]|uniref:Uncharacterized protein n=1 Tax=Trichogramma brassicae TaxID=86971 RepID=A0A6H5HZA7_9HYME|nr:unnamed protein product [Trichogramma brassicae]